jgi:hypothetical protein
MDGDNKTRPDSERGYEIGMDEAWKVNMKALFDFTFMNMKRTYDEYQQISLEGIKNQQKYQEKILSDAQQNDNARQILSVQLLQTAVQANQNAVETANMVAKQAVRHSDIAIDRQWNIDEVAKYVSDTQVFTDKIAAEVAKQIKAQAK